jgi:hypothetical protein
MAVPSFEKWKTLNDTVQVTFGQVKTLIKQRDNRPQPPNGRQFARAGRFAKMPASVGQAPDANADYI